MYCISNWSWESGADPRFLTSEPHVITIVRPQFTEETSKLSSNDEIIAPGLNKRVIHDLEANYSVFLCAVA